MLICCLYGGQWLGPSDGEVLPGGNPEYPALSGPTGPKGTILSPCPQTGASGHQSLTPRPWSAVTGSPPSNCGITSQDKARIGAVSTPGKAGSVGGVLHGLLWLLSLGRTVALIPIGIRPQASPLVGGHGRRQPPSTNDGEVLASFPGSSLLPPRMTFDRHDKLSGGRAWEILSHDQRHATSPIH